MKKLEKNLYYLLIYSFLGFCLETLVGFVTKGVIESRKSFLVGPFCVIYGIGGIILINFLQKYKNQNLKLFIFGMILGSLVEFLGSFLGEKLLGFVWWDYSNQYFNLYGRTSLMYAIIWGILSIILINYLNPLVDKLYNFIIQNISSKYFKVALYFIVTFFVFDGIASSIVLNNFYNKTIYEYNIGTPIEMSYLEIDFDNYKSSKLSNLISNNISYKKFLKIYPNILLPTASGKYVNLDNLTHINDNYYIKIFEPLSF